MTTQTATLAEFLLARIAEKEATAINYTRFEVRDGIPGRYVIKDEVLADCEAKRRIVDWAWDNEVVIDGEWGPGRDREELEADGVHPKAIQLLALPYADHADYDAEWRP